MDGDAAVVQQDPRAAAIALPVQGLLTSLLCQQLFHIVYQRVDLGIAGAGGQNEIVRQRGQLGDLHHADLFALLIGQGTGGQQRQFFRCFHDIPLFIR